MSSATAAASGGNNNNTSKRSSSRTVVISKAMRVVDDETRNEEAMKRIKQLESDAYMDELLSYHAVVDDAYEDDDESILCHQQLYTRI